MRIIYQIIYYLFWDQEIKMPFAPIIRLQWNQWNQKARRPEGWKKLAGLEGGSEGQNIILRKLPVSVVCAGDVVECFSSSQIL